MSKLILHKSYELQQKEVNLTDVVNSEDTSYTLIPDEGHLLNKVTVNNDLNIMKEYVEQGGKLAYSYFTNKKFLVSAAPFIVNGQDFFHWGTCTDTSDMYLDLKECTTACRFFYDANYSNGLKVENLTINMPKCTNASYFFVATYSRVSCGWRNIKIISSDKLVNVERIISDNSFTESLEITECKSCDSDFYTYRCHNLKKLILKNNGEGFTKPHYIFIAKVNSIQFTRETFMEMVESLADISKNSAAAGSYIGITTEFEAKLTDEDKEIITNKGWILSAQ